MKNIAILIFINISILSFSQNRIIEGKVYNIGGGVIAGVRVFAKEAPVIFTLTDKKGNYKLDIPEEVTKIVFSYTDMFDKTVKIGKFSTLNVRLVPSNLKKIRFGVGFAFGTSKFEIFNIKSIPDIPDTTKIILTPISINANIFYKFNENIDLQTLLSEGLNVAKLGVDSITTIGDTIKVTKNVLLNRISFAVVLNYNFNISKTKNHSAFVGLGPQFQHLGYFKTNTIGFRFQGGVNINNYGLTTRLFASVDISNGKFEEDIASVYGLDYRYLSSRIGLVFIF